MMGDAPFWIVFAEYSEDLWGLRQDPSAAENHQAADAFLLCWSVGCRPQDLLQATGFVNG